MYTDHLTVDVYKAYILDCKVRGLSTKTMQSYTEVLQQFVDVYGPTPIQNIQPSIIREYLLTRDTAGGRHLVYRYLRAMLLFWERETDGEYRSPTHRVQAPRVNRDSLPPIPLNDIKRLLDTCKSDFHGIRDKALILSLLDTGTRARAFLSIDVDDVDATLGTMLVTSKGDRLRTVYLGRKSRQALRKWLKHKPSTRALWTDVSGLRLGYDGLRSMIRRRSATARIDPPKIHAFRRTFAITMLRSGVDVYTLARLMGHSDIRTLQSYLSLTTDDLQTTHREHSPVDSL
jgi:integrase/recombinase XerC/integrase/recombinase XerD